MRESGDKRRKLKVKSLQTGIKAAVFETRSSPLEEKDFRRTRRSWNSPGGGRGVQSPRFFFPPALKPRSKQRGWKRSQTPAGYGHGPKKPWRGGGPACRGHQGQEPWPACPTARDGQRERFAEDERATRSTRCPRGRVLNHSRAGRTPAINPETSAVTAQRDAAVPWAERSSAAKEPNRCG